MPEADRRFILQKGLEEVKAPKGLEMGVLKRFTVGFRIAPAPCAPLESFFDSWKEDCWSMRSRSVVSALATLCCLSTQRISSSTQTCPQSLPLPLIVTIPTYLAAAQPEQTVHPTAHSRHSIPFLQIILAPQLGDLADCPKPFRSP